MIQRAKIFIKILFIIFVCGFQNLFAVQNSLKPKEVVWPFEGVFGKIDKQSAQRGAQIYLQVCGACHGMKHLYYRNLVEIGFSEEEIKTLAKSYLVIDGPNDEGEMFERNALLSDHIVSPYPNAEAAKFVNNGIMPPDLSLMIKARPNGANYVYSLLTGYQDIPNDFQIENNLYYNPYFEGMKIAMAPPLVEGQVEFMDGTEASIEQMSKDVVVFLQWAAEPEMEQRKSMGLKVTIFLIIFSILSYISMKNIWKDIK
ncbi:MAG: cytochrome c1 [Rickettsia sp.]|nr:cytochrome c1 [Rickettsia sp.]